MKNHLNRLLINLIKENGEYSDSIKKLLELNNTQEIEFLKNKTTEITQKFVGNKVYFRGIIEFSNVCEKNCYYCGIRKDNKKIKRYLMDEKKIIDCALFAAKNGYGSIVLQSGELTSKNFIDYVIKLVANIKKLTKKYQKNGLGITLSIGEQSKKVYQELYDAGAHRYLLRIETSNKNLYRKLHPDDEKHSFEKRLNCLKHLKEIGYQLGTGVMIGLPGQTIEDLVNDVIFYKNIDADMIGMGPYVIHTETPLRWYEKTWQKNRSTIFNLSLKMIAVTRLLLKDVNIAATTALQTFHPYGRELGILFGANVIMPIITPLEFRKHYMLYENKPCIDEDATKCNACLLSRIKKINKDIGLFEYGDSQHFKNKKKHVKRC
ncbi:MAG: [FeFe] hydrogenase H-cluster radical SAM maturase HydE [Candidatus Micrarchaeota archaeon]|nr:[FeFe] hydrogenase H-cluster radical SAM maturase HydE [Candidatus Micrarchaeota archaeon]